MQPTKCIDRSGLLSLLSAGYYFSIFRLQAFAAEKLFCSKKRTLFVCRMHSKSPRAFSLLFSIWEFVPSRAPCFFSNRKTCSKAPAHSTSFGGWLTDELFSSGQRPRKTDLDLSSSLAEIKIEGRERADVQVDADTVCGLNLT